MQKARGYVHRTIGGGKNNQCAIFVRKVFFDAGVTVASSKRPTDMAILQQLGQGLSPDCADSFAGDDVGKRVSLQEARPGDVVLYRGTDPTFPPMTITHVGIYAGNGEMIDCGGGGLVHKRPVWKSCLAEIRRPHAYGGSDYKRWRVATQGGQAKVTLDGAAVGRFSMEVGGPTPRIHGAPVKLAAAKVEIVFGESSAKYYLHHGKAQFLSNGSPGAGTIKLQGQGGTLHIFVNGNEVKPSSVLVELAQH